MTAADIYLSALRDWKACEPKVAEAKPAAIVIDFQAAKARRDAAKLPPVQRIS